MTLTKKTELSLLHDPAGPNRALKTSNGKLAFVADCAACAKCRRAVGALALAVGAAVAMISVSATQAQAAGQIITHGPVAQRPNGEIVRGRFAGPRAVRPNGQVVVGKPGTGKEGQSSKSARVGATPGKGPSRVGARPGNGGRVGARPGKGPERVGARPGKGPQRVGARPGKPTPRVRDFRESRRSARTRTNSGTRR